MSALDERPLSRTEHILLWCFDHWLLLLNGLVLLYAVLPWLSPLLIALGYPEAGRLLFALYIPLCHQYPDRSFWLLGHQVAYCHRDTAMYTALALGGLYIAVVGVPRRPLPVWAMLLLLLPLALDGGSHTLNDWLPALPLRSDMHDVGSLNWWLRMLTGGLFALAVLWGVYPRLERDLRAPAE